MPERRGISRASSKAPSKTQARHGDGSMSPPLIPAESTGQALDLWQGAVMLASFGPDQVAACGGADPPSSMAAHRRGAPPAGPTPDGLVYAEPAMGLESGPLGPERSVRQWAPRGHARSDGQPAQVSGPALARRSMVSRPLRMPPQRLCPAAATSPGPGPTCAGQLEQVSTKRCALPRSTGRCCPPNPCVGPRA